MIVCFSSLVRSADEYITLPSQQSASAKYRVTEQVNINTIHAGEAKSFKELMREAREDNKKSWDMVAYLYREGRSPRRAYVSKESFEKSPHHNRSFACSHYKITFTDPEGYKVTHINDELLP